MKNFKTSDIYVNKLFVGDDFTYIDSSSSNDLLISANKHINFSSWSSGVETTNMTISEQGNIGIGTSNPARLLHLKNSNSAIAFETPIDANGSAFAQIKSGRDGSSGYSSTLEFATTESTTAVPTFGGNGTGGSGFVTRMLIDSTGNVGIGTNTPIHALELYGKGKRLALTSDHPDGTRINHVELSSDGSGYGYMMVYNDVGNPQARIHSSGTSYFNGGNVGVGTTNPDSPLTVVEVGNVAFKMLKSDYSNLFTIGEDGGNSTILSANRSGGGLIFKTTDSASTNEVMRMLSNGNVGLGTSNPQERLTIRGPGTSDYTAIRTSLGGVSESNYYTNWSAAGGFKVVRNSGTAGNLNIGIDTPDGTGFNGPGGHINFFTNNSGQYASRLFINRNGSVGVGDGDFPNVKFSVSGSLQAIYGYRSTTTADHDLFTLHSDVGGSNTTKFKVEADGDVWSSSSTYSSDARLKTEIEELGHGLDTLKQLQPKQYKMIGSENKGLRYGFVAQEIETVLPDLVRDIEINDDKYKSLEYNSIIAILTKSIQEQQQIIDKQQQIIDKQQQVIDQISERINNLRL